MLGQYPQSDVLKLPRSRGGPVHTGGTTVEGMDGGRVNGRWLGGLPMVGRMVDGRSTADGRAPV